MAVTRELFELQRHHRFGSANPERMQLEYWEWLARNKWDPYGAMKHFGVGLETINGPDWCLTRFGMSTTQMPDGRVIHIGGEYEDSYDAEFCIFNDVVVIGSNEEISIFGYPRSEFPPTDFHTATLDGSQVVLIGCLGYPADRIPGHTPVFSLDTTTYKLRRLETAGDNPGWLYEHSAAFDSNQNSIVVGGGKVILGNRQLLRNFDKFELCLGTLQWKRLTNKRWPQFQIIFFDEDGKRCYPQPRFELSMCLPNRSPDTTLDEQSEQGWKVGWKVIANEVPITFWDDHYGISIAVEGELPDDVMIAVLNDVKVNIQGQVQSKCLLERLV